jgi:hypothetical protein
MPCKAGVPSDASRKGIPAFRMFIPGNFPGGFQRPQNALEQRLGAVVQHYLRSSFFRGLSEIAQRQKITYFHNYTTLPEICYH